MSQNPKEEYESLLDRIEAIFTGIVEHAQEQSYTRCPYRTREDECTARFCCGNRQSGLSGADGPLCGHEGGLDYRNAWKTDQEADSSGAAERGRE